MYCFKKIFKKGKDMYIFCANKNRISEIEWLVRKMYCSDSNCTYSSNINAKQKKLK